ncbi:hypothetical protein [Actinophytocola sp.]|uniref:hypothetical protein n=1 Tax=Actinophytocola sp. TaxID=1872138 RepID=UPI00389A29DF
MTISSLCREAGVGRDSYYRSPQQFKDTAAAAFARREAQQPELVTLREELATLKREKKQTAQDNAHAVRPPSPSWPRTPASPAPGSTPNPT